MAPVVLPSAGNSGIRLRMHIAVDAVNVLHDRRGIGRYARAMLRRWMQRSDEARITLLLPQAWPQLARRRLAAAIGTKAVEVARRCDVVGVDPDVVWYPWNGMTWVSPLPSIATIHDVWPFASPAQDMRKRRNEQTPFRATAEHTVAILTDSLFSKNEVVKYLAVEPRKLHVVPLGVDPPPSLGERSMLLDGASRYVLFVGESEPRKDLATLQLAMTKLPDALRMTTGLVIAGKPGTSLAARGRIDWSRHQGKKAAVLRFEPADSVSTIVTGEVSDLVLHQLYAGAAAFAFPSRYEGFGLPVLEAMSHGIPAVVADAASIPEVAGDAALYYPPGNAEALAGALARVITDVPLAAQLRVAGLARASALTWDRCADATLRVFYECLSDRSRAAR